MLEHSLIKDSIVFEDGMAHLPEGPGWGVDLDMDAIEKYQTSETITIKA